MPCLILLTIIKLVKLSSVFSLLFLLFLNFGHSYEIFMFLIFTNDKLSQFWSIQHSLNLRLYNYRNVLLN